MKIRYQIDLLVAGILLAVLIAALAPTGSTRLDALGGRETTFPLSYSIAGKTPSLDPAPATYKALGNAGRIVVGQYGVRPGDSLELLARKYGSTPDSLRSTNRLSSVYLSPNKSLLIHNGRGMLHQVREEKGSAESLRGIARRYNQSSDDFLKKFAAANRLPGVALLSGHWLEPGTLLFVPDARLRFTDYDLPVAWARGKRLISSGFGYRRHPILRYRKFHSGLDMPRPHGFPVKASREGRVIFAGWRGGYGRLIIIKHPGGLRTWYGHLSSVNVSAGQRVNRGQFIGRVGSTGLSTGPHLHFEVRDRFGNSLNPKKFLF
ncbi:MAG: peptidoglycan DD-metalloendopeptidase family protein [Elusimicrobiota bacterium]